MRFRSTFLMTTLAAVGGAASLWACPATNSSNSSGGAGEACSAPGSQSNCAAGLACKNFLDVPAPGGTQTIAVCEQTCTSNSDCNATYTKNVCASGFCSCTPGPVGSDSCTAANPNTVCHPDYDYCATAVDGDAGSCNPGEAPALYNGVTICRPTGTVTDAGTDGGSTTCGYANSQGNCPWPQFCSGLGGVACAFPQNVDDAGADSPDPACSYTGGPDGTDNADQLRQSKGSPFAPAGGGKSAGPILISMTQDTSGIHCGTELGGTDTVHSALCFGDGKYCGLTDDVAVFNGSVYDPAANFGTNEGMGLDGQFFAIAEAGSSAGQGQALSSMDATLATIQIGHVVPEQGNWSTVGGQFVLWRCFSAAGVDGGPAPVVTQVGGSLIPAHYAKTTGGPGNTFCSTWSLNSL
jgi:hypothetical protein